MSPSNLIKSLKESLFMKTARFPFDVKGKYFNGLKKIHNIY